MEGKTSAVSPPWTPPVPDSGGTVAPVRLRYQTLELGELDLHLRTLRDTQQFADAHGAAADLGIGEATWPLFGIVWASGRVLAHLMLDRDVDGLRILEVGCGIGLASLVLNHREADITATDHHPEAGPFLRENVRLNGGTPIPFQRTGWTDVDDTLGTFDLIIGSDLLYQPDHAGELAGFIARHARARCDVVLVDPGRGNLAAFDRELGTHGFVPAPREPADDLPDEAYRGQVLAFHREAVPPP